jgi:hypothetical protein
MSEFEDLKINLEYAKRLIINKNIEQPQKPIIVNSFEKIEYDYIDNCGGVINEDISSSTSDSDEPTKIIEEILDENFYKTLATIWKDEKATYLGRLPTTVEVAYNAKSTELEQKDHNIMNERHLSSSKKSDKDWRSVYNKQCKSRIEFLETMRQNDDCFIEQPLIKVQKKNLNKTAVATSLGKQFCDSIIKRYQTPNKDIFLDNFKDTKKTHKKFKNKTTSI